MIYCTISSDSWTDRLTDLELCTHVGGSRIVLRLHGNVPVEYAARRLKRVRNSLEGVHEMQLLIELLEQSPQQWLVRARARAHAVFKLRALARYVLTCDWKELSRCLLVRNWARTPLRAHAGLALTVSGVVPFHVLASASAVIEAF